MLIDILINSAPALVFALAVAGVLSYFARRIALNRKVQKLGGWAQAPTSKFFGIDFVLRSHRYAKENKNLLLWEEREKSLGSSTTEVHILGTRIIMTSDPENIKAVLATQFNDFGKGKTFHDQWHSFLGDSIFTTDGKQWAESRALIRPQFIKDRISDLHTFERHIQHLFSKMPTDGQTVFDISNLMFRFTLDSATEFLLGQSVNSIENPKVEFSEAFAKVQVYMNDITRAGPLWWAVPKGDYQKNLKVMNNFVEPFVMRTLQMRAEDLRDKKENDYNFLHALAQYTRDPRMLRDQLVAVLLAARDTSAGTMSWTLWHLSQQPETVKKLRKEILDRLGDREPTYTDLKEMKYLQAVINETLRLYPAVPFNIRYSLKDTSLPHGNRNNNNEPIGIPAGTPIGYSALAMQRSKELFGEDVNEFIPERWEKGVPKAWQYIPFNGGPRICIGQQFALTEMGYVLCRLFQRYETIELKMDKEKQYMRCEITITPGAGVYVTMGLPKKE